MIEAVIFDLDDTLVHLPINYENLFQEVKRILRTDDVQPFLKAVSKVHGKKQLEVFKAWDEAELEALPKTTIILDGQKAYGEFYQKHKALVTMQGKALVEALLNRFRFTFEAVVTREDSLNRINQLELARQKLGLEFENILFIGNKEYDALAAKKVGCQFQKVEE